MLAYGYYGMFFNPWFLLFAAPGMLLAAYASWLVKSRAKEMGKIKNLKGMTGAEIARKILDANGIQGVTIEKVSGRLSDYYSPKLKKLALSEIVHSQTSITALGVAAHEVGHALQDKDGYGPLVLRQTVAPFAIRGQQVAMILLMAGFIIGNWIPYLVEAACVIFFLFVIFTLITLPVEFNASSRALAELGRLQLSGGEEWEKTKKVLNAAALTYVASAASAIGMFLYMLMQANRRR